MNRAKPLVAYLPKERLRPELSQCPHCHTELRYSHPVWAKPIYGLEEARFVTSLGYRCPNAACSFPRTVYRSAQAEALSLKGSSYALEVVVRIGHLWLHEHRNRREIHALLQEQVPLSERHVQNLFESYLALLRCNQARQLAQLGALAQAQGGLVLSLDGLRPENGNESLYVLREVLSGTVLWAECLQEADHATLAAALQPLAALHLPLLGIISDLQESISLAVAAALPAVPHAFCHFHVLREAAKPLFEADRHMKKQIKQEVRGLRAVERAAEEALAAEPGEQAPRPMQIPLASAGNTPPCTTSPGASATVQDTVPPMPVATSAQSAERATTQVVQEVAWAMRQTLLEGGQTPFHLGGLHVYEDLDTLGQTVEACLAKKGMCGSKDC